MAKMYPDRLPEGLASDAEYDLFAALHRELDDRYTVFAGVKWMLKGGRHGLREGEADFVIAHPDRGLLVVEVKGGAIGRDGTMGRWYSVDRHGERHEIGDPFQQAQRNAHALHTKLAEAPKTASFRFVIGHAVALPDVRLAGAPPGLAATREATIDLADYGRLQAAVERVFTATLGDQAAPFGSDGMRALIDVISPSWEVQIALRARLRDEREQFRRLTEEQFFVLEMLAGHRHALIDGCAGSGKTFLALEKARRLADEGFDTLLTCFNKNLAAWIRESLASGPARLRVQHFHELAHQLVESSGIDPGGPGSDPGTYFSETLPGRLADAISRMETRFDAIIVDEGQDFEPAWWVPLMELLRSPDDGVMYVFYDGRQSIYTDGPALPFGGDPHYLTVNLRNTQAIHRTIATHYQGRKLTCRGPEGRPPRHIRSANPEDALRTELHRLVHTEGIPVDDIVVLTAASQRRSRWQEGQRFGNLRLTWDPSHDPDQVRVSTIHSFKGLERPVVIVTEMDEGSGGPRREQLQLVAWSRAASELITIATA